MRREDLGRETAEAVISCVNRPLREVRFFAGLAKAIEREKIKSHYREEADLGKHFEQKIRNFKNLIEYKEKSENRIMSENGKIQFISNL
jgi:hypothetical protein